MKCEVAGCDCNEGPFYLHSKCHMSSPTWVTVHGDVLTVLCAECDKQIATFKVVQSQKAIVQ